MGQAQCWLILLLYRVSQKNSPGTELCPFDLALARRVARDVRKRRGGARHPAQFLPNVGVADSDELEGRGGAGWGREREREREQIFPPDVSGVADNDERKGRDGAGREQVAAHQRHSADVTSRDITPASGRRGARCARGGGAARLVGRVKCARHQYYFQYLWRIFRFFCENFPPDIGSVADNDEHEGGGGGGGGSGIFMAIFFDFFAKISRPTSAASPPTTSMRAGAGAGVGVGAGAGAGGCASAPQR
ncbi:hypothetical protein GGX14DRAFT_652735 [Mycena pura]|uniref:Uncharacterized protein n=1 Tax=Mycena pura TaxID=153505 RepID=A0AAD6V5C3_9AGAR|nr:hypothetical protein GGX14DRAFT_652735 [Mycena pura]